MSRGRLVFVFGTRPEAIKLGPVVAALQGRAQVTVICTGQHTDLLKGTPAETDLSGALSLGLTARGDYTNWANAAVVPISLALKDMLPIACVVVQGDTMSALAGARAAHALNLPLAHVEAGLRSHDLENPWPEEGIRIEITRLADWHYAPTATSVANLLAEGITRSKVFQTGNSVVSALARYASLDPCPTPDPRILITMHRREWLNRGHFHVLQTIDALFEAATHTPDTHVLWLVHPSFTALVGDIPIAPRNVHFVSPFPYADTIDTLRTSLGVITDSGGLQEEAATLGVPCVVLRHATDRPESIDAGATCLAPPTPDGMAWAVRKLVRSDVGMIYRHPSACYGTPDAADRIASHLASLT